MTGAGRIFIGKLAYFIIGYKITGVSEKDILPKDVCYDQIVKVPIGHRYVLVSDQIDQHTISGDTLLQPE